MDKCGESSSGNMTPPIILTDEEQLARAEALTAEGDHYFEADAWDAAEPRYLAALCLLEHTLGENDERVAVALNRLANVHYKRKEDEAAAELFARALAIREAVLSPDAPELRLSVNNLANCYRNLGRFAEAEPLYRRSLAMLERQTGHTNHPSVWKNLARILNGQGKTAEAEAFTEKIRAYEAAQAAVNAEP